MVKRSSSKLLLQTIKNDYMDLSDLFKKVLIKDDQHVLYSDSSGTVIYQEYFHNKPLNEQQVSQVNDFLAGRQYVAYLLNVNGGSLIPYEDETWVEKLDLSVLSDAGILFMAYISPNNIFSSLEIEKEINTDEKKKIKIRIFKDPEDAISWLKSFHIL
jgi:hydroxymethylpyrimidine pyrophosphatase-like HAD family hydrolase